MKLHEGVQFLKPGHQTQFDCTTEIYSRRRKPSYSQFFPYVSAPNNWTLSCNFIVFSNAYNKVDTINELLDDLCRAIIERRHCQIHFVTGNLEAEGENPNENETGCRTAMHYVKEKCKECKNVHIHSLGSDKEAVQQIGRAHV